MAGNQVFRDVMAGDIDALVERMRQADIDECIVSGFDPRAAVVDGVQRSVFSKVLTVDGDLMAIFGVAPLYSLMDETGVPWLLGTDKIVTHQRAFIKNSPAYINLMLSAFPHLLNFVHADNKVSVSWLERMGFQLAPAEPFGPRGALFHRFEMRAEHVQRGCRTTGHSNRRRRDVGARPVPAG